MISIIKSILSVLISVLFINKLNILQFISIIPDEYSFEIYLTIYLSIFDFILNLIEEKIKSKFYGKIECIFHESNENIYIDSNPSISFVEDVCFVYCTLKMKGPSSLFKDNSIIISLPNWFSVQADSKSIAKTNVSNEFIIMLNELVSQNDINVEDIQVKIKLGFIREEFMDDYSYTMTPRLKKNCRIKYTHNKAYISNKNRR